MEEKFSVIFKSFSHTSHLLTLSAGRESSQLSLSRHSSWDSTFADTAIGLISPKGSNILASVLKMPLLVTTFWAYFQPYPHQIQFCPFLCPSGFLRPKPCPHPPWIHQMFPLHNCRLLKYLRPPTNQLTLIPCNLFL